MAEIEGGGGGGKHKGKKPHGKKLSTRVDFTPMVDLGFLLITFFMLTTSMNKPQTMEINMPDKEKTEDPTVIPESQTLTLILGEKNRIFYYFGLGNQDLNVEVTNFSNNGIRKLLIEESKKRNRNLDSIAIYRNLAESGKIKLEEFKRHAGRIKADKNGLIVLIKAEEKSKYRNLVDILDEMLICNIGRYAIVDISDVEKQMISNL